MEALLAIALACAGLAAFSPLGLGFRGAIAGGVSGAHVPQEVQAWRHAPARGEAAPSHERVPGPSRMAGVLSGTVLRSLLSMSGEERRVFDALHAAALDAGLPADDAALEARRATLLDWDSPPPASLDPFDALGDGPLGSGHYHDVFAVADDADVVVKVRRADQLGERGNGLASEWKHAIRLHRALGGPRVEGIVRITLPGGEERVGIALERLRGRTLKAWLTGDEAAPAALVRGWRESATALTGRVAKQDVGLEDFHPGNIFLTDDGRVVPFDIRFRASRGRDFLEGTEFVGGIVRVMRNVEDGLAPLAYADSVRPFFRAADAERLQAEAGRLLAPSSR